KLETPAVAHPLKCLALMKFLRGGLFVAGLVVLAILVVRVGLHSVLTVLGRLSWWQLVLVSIPYGLIMAVDTLGWRYAFVSSPPPYLRMLAARTATVAVAIVAALGSVGRAAVRGWRPPPPRPYARCATALH